MNLKKHTALAVASILMLSAFAACSSAPPAAQNPDASQTQSTSNPQQQGFILKYPQDMQDLGFTEDIYLDQMPTRIAAMTTYPVMTLHTLGANLVVVPETTVITYPDDLKAEQLPGLMSEQFDLERVVAAKPDLVILPISAKDTHGKTLEDLQIPVYYMAISSQEKLPIYDVIKNQTQVFIDAFAQDAQAKEAAIALMQRFTDLEATLETVKTQYSDKKVLVLMTADPTTHFIQSADATLGSILAMIGFQNVYQPSTQLGEGSSHKSVPIDMETALTYSPDLVVFTGKGSQSDMDALVSKTIAQNPTYWNSIDAIRSGQYITLPGSYVSIAGINIIESVNDLIEILNAQYAGQGVSEN